MMEIGSNISLIFVTKIPVFYDPPCKYVHEIRFILKINATTKKLKSN